MQKQLFSAYYDEKKVFLSISYLVQIQKQVNKNFFNWKLFVLSCEKI